MSRREDFQFRDIGVECRGYVSRSASSGVLQIEYAELSIEPADSRHARAMHKARRVSSTFDVNTLSKNAEYESGIPPVTSFRIMVRS